MLARRRHRCERDRRAPSRVVFHRDDRTVSAILGDSVLRQAVTAPDHRTERDRCRRR
jgi:hypothetical protein